jgi:hypothetical protein
MDFGFTSDIKLMTTFSNSRPGEYGGLLCVINRGSKTTCVVMSRATVV